MRTSRGIAQFAFAGFSLIELAAVLMVLGIMAAVAVPQILDLRAEARYAMLQRVAGALRHAAALVHAQALLEDQLGETGTVTFNGQIIALRYGYPDATMNGIDRAINGLAGFPAYTGTMVRAGAEAGPPPFGFYYFGYSPIDGTVNGCFATYEMATATTPPVAFIWADRRNPSALGSDYVTFEVGGPGPGQCRSSAGRGPGAS